MIHSSVLHSRTRKLLATFAGLVAITLLGIGIQTNQQFLRTSAVVSDSENAAEAPLPADTDSTYTTAAYQLRHPTNWEPTEGSTSDRATTTIGPVVISTYQEGADISENTIANQLGAGFTDLHSWPGQFGNTSGTYWARRAETAGVTAPEGKRLYITKTSSATLSILLPQPPYDSGTNQIISSFSAEK